MDEPGGQPEWARLERQVERSQLFEHTALGRTALRLGEVESLLHGLVDVLLSRGLVEESALRQSVEAVQHELRETGEAAGAGVVVRVDPAEGSVPETPVDCAARLHVCRAVCCRLQFALTIREIEARRVKWDLGRPYVIRQEDDGACTHNDRASGRCTVYGDRPEVCRRYSCRHDARIWKDFERLQLNQEWLDAHLLSGDPERLTGVLMEPRPLRAGPPRDDPRAPGAVPRGPR